MKRPREYCTLFLFALGIVLWIPVVAEGQTPDPFPYQESVFPITAEMTGVDCLQDWFPDKDDQDPVVTDIFHNVGWSVVCIRGIKWDDIEISEGVYDWDVLDDAVEMYVLQGTNQYPDHEPKRLHLWISPTSRWASKDLNAWNPDAGGGKMTDQSPPQDQYMPNWQKFVKDLVDRYDNEEDGAIDHEGCRDSGYLVLWMLQICAEIENYNHWELWQGSPVNYFQTLRNAYLGADGACQEVLISRAAHNFSDIGNDNPYDQRMHDRLAGIPGHQNQLYNHLAYLNALLTPASQNFYDVWAMHPSGKYTSALAYVRYLRNIRNLLSPSPSGGHGIYICSEDTNVLPRNGNQNEIVTQQPPQTGWNLCSWIYPDEDSNNREDPIDYLNELNPPDPLFTAARNFYYSDQAGMLIKRFVFHLRCGVKWSFIQPHVDMPEWDKHIWHRAGLLSVKMANWATGDMTDGQYDYTASRKQAYWEYKWLYDKLKDVTGGKILEEESTDSDICGGNNVNDFFPLTCVYELTRNPEMGPLWVMWHDKTCKHHNNHPDLQDHYYYPYSVPPKTDQYTLNLNNYNATQVRVYYTIDQWNPDPTNPPLQPSSDILTADSTTGDVTLTFGDLPIIVEIERP